MDETPLWLGDATVARIDQHSIPIRKTGHDITVVLAAINLLLYSKVSVL